ncbi:MAG: hypothetical protein J6S67_23720 [Methanobrevibacter sp.]|nr:hypothetical protein [Methanobrevibacter sp.]
MLRFLFWMFVIGIFIAVIALMGLIIIPLIIGTFGILAGVIAFIVAITVMFCIFMILL